MEALTDILVPMTAIIGLFVVLPYLFLRHAAHKRELELKHRPQVADPQLLELAQRMEQRIEALEKLLDVEVPGWREKHREQA
ncbi:phage shock protein B [Solimonas aquatica]|uniref:Phage shock protein B n=1 Tax=Solimonas aquatica TaxID=489703 RepID=A0A1H8ZKZ2_9GAMM|nr:hypothetical protein [Solimonas aquatica]SEP65035.1 phage shock protein B [Solimonas aquatica]